jgi:hypothetical protein
MRSAAALGRRLSRWQMFCKTSTHAYCGGARTVLRSWKGHCVSQQQAGWQTGRQARRLPACRLHTPHTRLFTHVQNFHSQRVYDWERLQRCPCACHRAPFLRETCMAGGCMLAAAIKCSAARSSPGGVHQQAAHVGTTTHEHATRAVLALDRGPAGMTPARWGQERFEGPPQRSRQPSQTHG